MVKRVREQLTVERVTGGAFGGGVLDVLNIGLGAKSVFEVGSAREGAIEELRGRETTRVGAVFKAMFSP